MIVNGYDLNEISFIGFWDKTLFKHSDSGSGYLFQDNQGNYIKISYADIKRAKRGLKSENKYRN